MSIEAEFDTIYAKLEEKKVGFSLSKWSRVDFSKLGRHVESARTTSRTV